MEIDIWVESANEIVAIEVKSDLEIQNVKRFLEMLARFKEIFTRFQNYKVYGAVAGIKIDEKAAEYASREGLYLIQPAGDSVIIANSQNLKRRVW
jgi:RecB family endonuclease NucS